MSDTLPVKIIGLMIKTNAPRLAALRLSQGRNQFSPSTDAESQINIEQMKFHRLAVHR